MQRETFLFTWNTFCNSVTGNKLLLRLVIQHLFLCVAAAFKVIKAWLPPAAVKKIKFLTKSNMGEYVSEDNRLEEWGGTDTWQYAWQPETQEAAFEGEI